MESAKKKIEDKKYRIAYLDDAIPAGQMALALLEEDFVNKDSGNQAGDTISQFSIESKRNPLFHKRPLQATFRRTVKTKRNPLRKPSGSEGLLS